MARGTVRPVLRKTRDQLERSGRGLLAETYNLGASSGASILTSGRVYFSAVGLFAGDRVSNISCMMTVAGTKGVSGAAFVGLYDKAGTKLAISADATTQFTGAATAALTIALVGAPIVITADDLYYLAVFSNFATTQPTLLRGSASTESGYAVASTARKMAQQSSQSSMPDPSATLADGTINYWLAAS